VLTFAFAGGGIRMGEFHRKSSAKKECIVGIKEKRQEEKEEEEERRKTDGSERKKEIYIYIRGSRKKCCVLYTRPPFASNSL
jgi:hypothetical protein